MLSTSSLTEFTKYVCFVSTLCGCVWVCVSVCERVCVYGCVCVCEIDRNEGRGINRRADRTKKLRSEKILQAR